ncbi:MAG TPA: DUF5906 domain-containing protein [Burkholderiales bacterium]|nr:DUF5906 domain-containing protein [Burkholderiales bacterium]
MTKKMDAARSDETANLRASIAERVELGRAQDTPAYGGIVPFPLRMTGSSIVNAPSGGALKAIQQMLAGGYKATVYEYKAETGETIQGVLRFDHVALPKEIKPVIYAGKSSGGGDVYQMRALKGQRPLYGLDRLKARPDAPVLVVEGEKTANAAAELFPDYVVVTWMAGAHSVHRTEMVALKGRNITLWPDNDEPGIEAMSKFAAFAYNAGATSISLVKVPQEFGGKWDLADDVPEELVSKVPLRALLEDAQHIAKSDLTPIGKPSTIAAESSRLLGLKPGYSIVDIEATATALSLFDPDMSRSQWLKIARCIFFAHGDKGADIFDGWSKGSTEKYRVGEPADLWKAFAQEKLFRALPLRWLFDKATQIIKLRNDEGEKVNVELDATAIYQAFVEELNDNHAVVVRAGKNVVLWERYDPQFDRYTQTYLTKRDFIDLHVRMVTVPQDETAEVKRKERKVSQGAAWYGSTYRRYYDGVLFGPGRNFGERYLNLWQGFAVEPTDNPDGWSTLKHHLLHHVAGGDADSYDYLLNWLASAVQHLDRPIGTALILLGKKGSGKSIVTDFLARLFGRHAFITSRLDDVLGKFNDRLEFTSLLGLEEAVAPGNRSADGILKDLLTRKTLRLEGKFFGVWDAPNYLRVIVTSNNDHVVRADGSERRYAVFEVVNPHQADPVARHLYFGQMVEQMKDGGLGAMLHELLNRDIAEWNAEVIPETQALLRQKQFSLSNDPVQMYLHERLIDGIQITTGDAAASVPIHLWSSTDTVMVPVRDLNEDFRAYLTRNGLRATERHLALNLPKYMPEGFSSKVRRAKRGDQLSVAYKAYPIPPLEEARKAFEAATSLVVPREPEE